jgi:hypothetical protein
MLAWLIRCLTCDDSAQEVTTTAKPSLTNPLLQSRPRSPVIGNTNFYQPPQITLDHLQKKILAGQLTLEELKKMSYVYEHNQKLIDDFICSGHSDHLLIDPAKNRDFIEIRVAFLSYRITQFEENVPHRCKLEKARQRLEKFLTHPNCHQPKF